MFLYFWLFCILPYGSSASSIKAVHFAAMFVSTSFSRKHSIDKFPGDLADPKNDTSVVGSDALVGFYPR